MSEQITGDLNQVIASAVQARIESEVATALSGSELMTQYVAAALHQKIQVEDRGSYRKRETTFMRETIDAAIREATNAAVRRVIAEKAPEIEAQVATEMRKHIKGFAKELTGKLVASAESPYGMTIEVSYRNGD